MTMPQKVRMADWRTALEGCSVFACKAVTARYLFPIEQTDGAAIAKQLHAHLVSVGHRAIPR